MKLVIFLWILANVLYLILGKRFKRTQNDLDDNVHLPFNDASKHEELQRQEDEMQSTKGERLQTFTIKNEDQSQTTPQSATVLHSPNRTVAI